MALRRCPQRADRLPQESFRVLEFSALRELVAESLQFIRTERTDPAQRGERDLGDSQSKQVGKRRIAALFGRVRELAHAMDEGGIERAERCAQDLERVLGQCLGAGSRRRPFKTTQLGTAL